MALGLKMFCARTAAGAIVDINGLQKGDDLTCESCNTPIIYNSGSKRGDGIIVSAYLRLPSNGRHLNTCKHDALGQITLLCGIGENLEGASRPLVALAQGKFEFRLNIPAEAISGLSRAIPGPAAKGALGNVKQRVQQRWSGAVLAPYCRSAVGLARIAALVEPDASLANVVSVRNGHELIQWKNFFFGEKSGKRLVTLLRSKKFISRRHPVAVLIRTKTIESDAMGASRNIRCAGEHFDAASMNVFVMPRIYASEEILREFEMGFDYIVFGEWSARPKRSDPDVNGRSYENISVEIYQSAQFCKLID